MYLQAKQYLITYGTQSLSSSFPSRSPIVTNLALSGLDDLVGACFGIEPDPFKVAELIDERIKMKRKGLGLEE